jgi:NAD(P)H-dependent FMN reductase
MNGHPYLTEAQRRRATEAFLEAHVEEDVVTQEIDLPGWDESTVEWLSEDYEEDVASVAAAEGVTFLSP